MTDHLTPDREGLDRGHIGRLPSREAIASEYQAIGDMRTALVRNAELATIDAAADSWSRVHQQFKDIPETLEADLTDVLSEWEGTDAEALRARVRDLAAHGGELAAGIGRTADEVLPYVRRHLGEAHMRAPFPEACVPGDVPTYGHGSRALTDVEKFGVWAARGNSCRTVKCWSYYWRSGYCCDFVTWHNEVFYPDEREAMVDAMTYGARALAIAQMNWDAPPMPSAPLTGDLGPMPEIGADIDTTIPGIGGGGGPTGPLPDPPDTDLGHGGGGGGMLPPGPFDPGDLLEDPTPPDGLEEFETGERPEVELENGNRAFHPWAIALIPDEEWERMARDMPDELWERLAADPHSIPPELAQFAPEHLRDSFPCNDPDWSPPLDADGNPIPFAVFDEELAGYMTPEMEHAIEDYDRDDGKAAWDERYGEDEPTADGGQSSDVTKRSWYQDAVD
jgi:hypothetical protein